MQVQDTLYNSLTRTLTLILPAGSLVANDQVVVQWSGLIDTQGRILADQTEMLVAN